MSEVAIYNAESFNAVVALDNDVNSLAELLEQNLGDQMSIHDLPKIVVPAGGGIVWTVKTANGPVVKSEFVGIVLEVLRGKAYWEMSIDDSNEMTPPDCRSDDCIYGVGVPGGLCEQCELNQFGSAKKGAGKACKDRSDIFLLDQSGILPTVLQVPPTSLKRLKDYGIALSNAGKIMTKTLTKISLSTEKKNGKDVSIMNFTRVDDAPAEMVQFVAGYRKILRDLITASRATATKVVSEPVAAKPCDEAPEEAETMPNFNGEQEGQVPEFDA